MGETSHSQKALPRLGFASELPALQVLSDFSGPKCHEASFEALGQRTRPIEPSTRTLPFDESTKTDMGASLQIRRLGGCGLCSTVKVTEGHLMARIGWAKHVHTCLTRSPDEASYDLDGREGGPDRIHCCGKFCHRFFACSSGSLSWLLQFIMNIDEYV